LWTSPNSLAILGITAQYIAEDNKLERSALALKEVNSEHSGENLAKYIKQVIVDWGFASRLGYFQMDNAGNNDRMLREISLRILQFHLQVFYTNLYPIQISLNNSISTTA
jgi:hypothetical protein